MPSRRLLPALLASLLIHGAPLAPGLLRPSPPQPPAAPLTVSLPRPVPPAADLLKNTLADAPPLPSPPLAPTKAPTVPGKAAAAQRKLAEHLFYPAEAMAAGWEGEVRLLLTLDPAGTVLEAEVAASSGHAVLDQAARRAAFAMGRLDNGERLELILPVVFHLH